MGFVIIKVMYRRTTSLSLRLPVLLNLPNHKVVTKRLLGSDQSDQAR